MTTAVRSDIAARSPIAGWTAVAGLAVRRERLPIGIWSVATILVVLSSVSAIAALYPDPASRKQLAATIAANPAFLALNGPIRSTSIGGVAVWRIGVYGALAVGYLGASTVVRRTRAEEETGRAELLASGVLGRYTLLATALFLAWAVSLAIGVACAIGCIAQGQPVGGSLALGVGLAGPGLVFSALAGVSAQIFESGRAALSATGVTLGVCYGIRGIADSRSSLHWLSYVTPVGWSQVLAPYGDTRWWVSLLFLVAAGALVALALRLLAARDIGRGLFSARLGPPGSRRLRGGITLAARLHRSQLLGWTIGLGVFGALTGSLAGTAGSLIADNARIEQIMQQVGGVGRPADELFAVMAALAGLLAAAYAIAAALLVRSEEIGGRAELVLSTSMSRTRLLAGHLVFALGGAAGLLVVAGLTAGLVRGAQSGDLATGLSTGLSAMAVQIPAVLVVGGLTAALIGWFPRQAATAWVLLGVFALLGQLGQTLGLPQTLLDVSPFTHTPPLPTVTFTLLPVAVLVVLAAVATAVGFAGLRRRDVG